MPFISIIIPNYNTAHYLVEAIDSVYKSTLQDFEIIVVDDGSKDDSDAVVAPFQQLENFRYIEQENRGLAGARNTGIREAKGEYLVFLDSDDIILPDKLFLQSEFLNANPAYDAVYSASVFFKDGEPAYKIETNFPNFSGQILQQLLYGNFIHVNAIMLKKEAVLKAGLFDEGLRELEDWDLWLRLSIAGSKFYYQHEVLSEVRLRKGSMTSNQIKMNATMVKVLEKNIPLLKKVYPNNKVLLVHANAALLQYKILANQKYQYNRYLLDTISEVGIIFLPTALKLFIKRYISNLYKFENKTTSRLEKVWNE